MEEVKNGADLSGPATAEAANEDMGGVMNQSQFADWLLSKGKAKAAPVETDQPEETAEVTTTEDAEEPGKAETAETGAPAEGDTTEGQEQPEEQPNAEEEEVLSKSDSNKPDKLAKWQEKTQKRIDELTAKAKAAEEAKAKLEAELTQLKSAPQPEATAPETVAVPITDPSDRTSSVIEAGDLVRMEREAQDALEFIEANELAITRAVAKDLDTVTLNDGKEYKVVDLERFKRDAKRHLEKHIPQRREFLKVREQAVAEAKNIMPALFDKRSPEYQQFQATRRQFPAVNALPSAELWYALAQVGMQTIMSQRQKKTEPVAAAAATPPKSGADTTPAAAPAKARGNLGEKAKLKAELDKATKEYESTGSQDAYARTLVLKGKLKRIS